MQLNPGLWPTNLTIKQGPRKGNRGPVRGTDGPARGTEGNVTGNGPILLHETLLIAPVPVTVLLVGLRVDPQERPVLWVLAGPNWFFEFTAESSASAPVVSKARHSIRHWGWGRFPSICGNIFLQHLLWWCATSCLRCTVVAEMITELICFEPEICICNGN